MRDRAAAAAQPPAKKRRKGLPQALAEALQRDGGEGLASGSEDSDGLPVHGKTPFMARRGTFRRVAQRDPGRLTVRVLAQFRMHINEAFGDAPKDELAPIVV
eukprot:3787357-Lingulodinium_polyedra.AAC.1